MEYEPQYQTLLQDDYALTVKLDKIKKELKQLDDDILKVTAKLIQQSFSKAN